MKKRFPLFCFGILCFILVVFFYNFIHPLDNREIFYDMNGNEISVYSSYGSHNKSAHDADNIVTGDVILNNGTEEIVIAVSERGRFITLPLEDYHSMNPHLSMDVVNSIIESKGINKVTWEDFKEYTYKDIGSGIYIYQYELPNNSYLYLSGSHLEIPPACIYIVDKNGKRTDLKK